MVTEVSNFHSSGSAVYSDRPQVVQEADLAKKVSQVSSESSHETQAELEDALAQLQEFSQSMRRALDFSVDSESGRSIVRVMDSETDQVIRQIPTEEAISIARNIERIKGILFEEQV